MSIESGHKLGHYEILELIGKGGMGEVYRAKDSKLGRDVAIKVLPDEFAQDEERLRRFQREAKVLASLNHPNIAAIYGLERSGDTHYLVLELVEGETLAERLARGPIPIDEAIEIASKIADAVEAAHERGIVHRDLKPANIMLAPDDNVKVLDFGLAKAFVEDTPDADNSMSPTLTRDATRVGVILGTAAYMSPEQAKGKRVDKRADIWAFGAVVYEMLTGTRAFTGEDVSDTLAAVLRAEPEWDAVPADVSPAVRTALARCLEKNLKRRVRDIGDVKLAMEGAFESAASRWSADAAPSRGIWERQGPALAVALALVSGLAVWGLMLTRARMPARPLARFVVTGAPSPNLFVGRTNSHVLTLSPDGSRVVYRSSGTGGGFRWLYERRLDQLEGTRIEGTQNATSPFFSPDGAWIGFRTTDGLKKIPTAGGTPVTIATLNGGLRGVSWGADGTIIFGDQLSRALYRVSAAGGEPEPLLEPGSVNVSNVDDAVSFRWPEILPGGHAVLFSIRGAGGNTNTQIAVLNLSSSEVTPLVSLGTYPRYAPSGHIVYGGTDGTLRAVPFDVDRLQVTGNPVALLDGVMTQRSGAIGFDLATGGSMVYATGSSQTATRLVWVDRAGREELIETAPMTFGLPRLSPDGRRIAVRIEDRENVDVHVVEPDRGTVVRLTRAPEVDTSPIWTADGTAIVFGSDRDGGGVFKIAADGSGVVERLAESAEGWPLPLPYAWSRDGDRIVFYLSGGPARGDIYSLAVESSQIEPLLALPDVKEAHPSLSPDGRWMAYTGNESGRTEIYVRPFPNVDDGRVLVSPAGGGGPLWSPDGRELFYWDDATRSMMVVPVTLTPTFSAGVATRLFEGNYGFIPGSGARHYDVSADGQRFLMIKPESSTEAGSLPDAQIVLVQNWFEELKRLVPADK